jgi:hypothetical protein
MEGVGHYLLQLQTWNLFGGTDGNHENLRCDGQDWNEGSPEYKCRLLPLDQLVRISDQNMNIRIRCSNNLDLATTAVATPI